MDNVEVSKFGKLRIYDSIQSVYDMSLFDYMKYIYPNDFIVEYESIPNDIVAYRTSLYGYNQSKNGITAIRAISKKHDIRIESQSLVVNILNRSWFQSANRIETTLAQNKYLESIGYRVINIPYYIQLSKEMIQYYFDVEVDRGCEYPSGFYDQEADSFHMIGMYPANFCIYGYKYFLDEYHKYPENVQSDIKQSILDAIFNYGEAAVLPYYEYLCDDLFELDFYPD